MEWYLAVLKKYAEFSGRARRKEYWMFALINVLVSVGLAVVDMVLGMGGLMASLYSLAVLLPSLAVAVRRLHDTNRSGWMFLIVCIPVIGAVVLLVFLAQEGARGDNRFGPDPKQLSPIMAQPAI